MFLFIATAAKNDSHIFLVKRGKIASEKNISFDVGRRNVLKDIDELLKDVTARPSSLRGIAVISGPGQFSCLRTGIIIANTMGFALSIPVTGVILATYSHEDFLKKGLARLARLKKFTPIVPAYGSEPNITMPKSENYSHNTKRKSS